ncbi:NAD(+) diphosphatase [Pseudonocardia sp. MH-G8]|uniref:NAD(+) diphosphatase n=1 Tax=Pseudonocardia sp. MH-G8 TaxID=1854588 RepID=UPI000BA022C9|nr:NAD(+) diphosphatase [Pseudonocardia sp. MH-G8]OZM83658.1 NADH pyrophosphatase [Pseudonocardia sp. MH-G8]
MSFPLIAPPVLSRSAVLRDEPLRLDVDRQLREWPSARLVVVDDKGRTPVDWGAAGPPAGPWDTVTEDGARLRTSPTSGDTPPADAVLLGEAEGVAYWGVRREAGEDQGEWADLRTAGAALDALGAGLLTGAVAVLNWHDAARFCGRDGSPMRPGNAGWHRVCEAHGHEEYPRTDPAIICLVHDGADQVLLARQPSWPEGRYSVLAGFVEAGESLEACVLREIHEEVGARVGDVRYLGSQAWPFPRSLMVGFSAVADPQVPLVPADGEIAEAMWVTRADLRRALEAGDWGASPEQERPLLLPGRVSIARSMLDSWAAL